MYCVYLLIIIIAFFLKGTCNFTNLGFARKLMRPPSFLDSFPLWLYYPSLIKWKISQRNQLDIETKEYLIYTINASILIDLATFIEGISCEMQSTIFFQRLDNKDKFQWNLFKHFDNRLNNSTWTNYVEFFDLLLGEKLISKIDNEKWKAISVLFNFRNSLVHGKEIEILYEDINNEPKVEAYDRHKKVFEYLKEKKLVDLTFKPNLNSVNLLNNKVVEHFSKSTIDFVENLFSILPESEIDDLKENFKECLTF